MHVLLKKPSCVALAIILLLGMPLQGVCDNAKVTVKKAELKLQGDDFVVSADIQFKLSEKATDALKNGVPLIWTYRFRIQQPSFFLWKTTLEDKGFRYRIQYHALLNMYRVKNENTGEMENFSTLRAALELLSTLRNYKFISKNAIEDKKIYTIGIKITFEKEELPLPLRPIAYLNPQWYLSSDWYEWTLEN
jgi:hypothetical protein